MKKTNAVRLLESRRIPYSLVEYSYQDEDLSVETIARQNGLPLEKIYKTLVAKGDKTGVVVAVIPGDKSLDFKALARESGNKKIAMVPVKEIPALTGYIRGGCSPIGMKKDYPVVIDASAASLDVIYVNAGAKGLLMGVAPQALASAAGGAFAEVAVAEG